MPTIRVDEEVYEWLQKMARPFEDTPNTVLRRVAGLEKADEKEQRMSAAHSAKIVSVSRRGSKTPQTAFRKPILKILKKLGGEAERMVVIKELERVMADQLSDFDKSDISSGTVRWQKSAEWEVRVMREKGLLKAVNEADRGVWALTTNGIKAVNNL